MRKLILRFLRWLFNGGQSWVTPLPDPEAKPLPPAEWPPVRKSIDWRDE